MDNRIKDNKLEQDLKTIVECEADSVYNEGVDDNDFEDNFEHLSKHSNQDTEPNLEDFKTVNNNQVHFEAQKYIANIFEAQTYTSPASFDSSSGYSCPFRNELSVGKPLNINANNLSKGK
jgi:hypothetical protein